MDGALNDTSELFDYEFKVIRTEVLRVGARYIINIERHGAPSLNGYMVIGKFRIHIVSQLIDVRKPRPYAGRGALTA
ncbi:hypothetical protein D3C76_1248870 [compost metagenome]